MDETSDDSTEANCDWRNGPAKYWYDLCQLPNDCQQFDYGFKLKTTQDKSEANSCSTSVVDSDDAFNLVSQIRWEKNVIWDSDCVRQKVLKRLEKPSIAGWIPIDDKRKAPDFVKQIEIKHKCIIELNPHFDHNNSLIVDNNNESMVKENICDINISNERAVNLRKRKSVNKNCIKDRTNCQTNESQNNSSHKPVVYHWVSNLHEENRNLIENRWEDNVIWDSESMETIPSPKIIPFESSDDNFITLLPHALSEDTNDSNSETFNSVNIFNISNDEYYSVLNKSDTNHNNIFIHHSIPALKLYEIYFPVSLGDYDHFYRPLLKRSRTMSCNEFHNVFPCDQKISQNTSFQSESFASRDLTNSLIKSSQDLTALEGDIVLMEYSEDEPPFLMRVGMGSKLINYYKKKSNDSSPPKKSRYGECKPMSESKFIGDLSPGQNQLALETNMFRATVFQHEFPETDFLIIRTSDSFYIRAIDSIFVVGQELPLMEVPRPKSKGHYELLKRMAKLFVYRLFKNRKSIMNLGEMLKNAFPFMSKDMIIKISRDFCFREGNRYILKGEMISEDQITDMLTPEDCCAYYSSSIAEQKFKERGYGDRLYLISDENDVQNKDDELMTAPWNTTFAYISTLKNRKLLNVSDYNEDASLVFSNQSFNQFKDKMPSIKKCVPVSKLSLKRMNLKRAHEWLINYGISKDKVKKLKNVTEVVCLISSLSDKLRENGVIPMTRMSTAEKHYKYECQKLFDMQTSIYSSKEVITTDEEEEEEDDEECDSETEEMGKFLEALVTQNKTAEEIHFDFEEKEREEFVRQLKGNGNNKNQNEMCKQSYKGKLLKIFRTYERNGKKYTRIETVRKTEVIESYVRIRRTKNEEFIKKLSAVGNHAEDDKLIKSKSGKKSKPKPIVINAAKTNGKCSTFCDNSKPLHNNQLNISKKVNESINEINSNKNSFPCDLDLSESSNDETEPPNNDVSIDGSKITFGKSVIESANLLREKEEKREREEREAEKAGDFSSVEYTMKRTSKRCRIDPMVRLKDIFDKTILEVRKREELDENIDYFLADVKRKEVPDYYDIIAEPICLIVVREKIQAGLYKSRKEFLYDMQLFYNNSVEYNGSEHQITKDAKFLYDFCVQKIKEKDEELERLENDLQNNLN